MKGTLDAKIKELETQLGAKNSYMNFFKTEGRKVVDDEEEKKEIVSLVGT